MAVIPQTAVKDSLHQDFVTVCGVPTNVVTCGCWLEELPNNDSSQHLVFVIPGNPGSMGYYIEFIKALHKGLHGTIPIWGVSHAGHVNSPNGSLPKLQSNESLYSLEGQIRHKMEFIDTYVPRNTNLILIGHSIGCYIILELLKRMPRLRVIRSILLFPAIERLSTTPNGRWMSPLLTYLYLPALMCICALSYLSPQTQNRLLEWYFKNRCVPQCIKDASLNFFQPDCVKMYIFMAKDELKNVKALDKDNIQQNISKITFYYGSNDHWCPISYYRDLKEIFPKGDIRLCKHNFEHAFVLENSREVGALAAGWILEALQTSKNVLMENNC